MLGHELESAMLGHELESAMLGHELGSAMLGHELSPRGYLLSSLSSSGIEGRLPPTLPEIPMLYFYIIPVGLLLKSASYCC